MLEIARDLQVLLGFNPRHITLELGVEDAVRFLDNYQIFFNNSGFGFFFCSQLHKPLAIFI